jgi:acetyl-CoA synthetase
MPANVPPGRYRSILGATFGKGRRACRIRALAWQDQFPTYDDFIAGFSAAAIQAQLTGGLDWGTNACIECCDQHAQPGRIALFWEDKDGRSTRVTFAELKERSARLANVLQARGIRPGDRVAGLLPRIPELLVVILGTWRAGAVYQPLFTAPSAQRRSNIVPLPARRG